MNIKKTKRPFLYELVLISWLVRNILPIITLITGHRYGYKLIELAIKYHVENGKLKIVFVVLWSAHLIAVLANLIYDIINYQLTEILQKPTSPLLIINFCSVLIEDVIYISINYSISFICWMISFGVYERLKEMRKQLVNSKLNLYEVVSIRKQFLQMRNDLIQADSCTQFGFFADCASITFTLMLNIYIFIAGDKANSSFIPFLTYCLIITPKLIGDCLVCGLVHDQADQLLKSVHQIDFDIKNERFYKELMLFKTISSEVNFGFTFGGLVPLERTALLSVS